MAKGYYDTTGSDYLNGDPSVSKEEPRIPEHHHDERYYQKEEVNTIQQGNTDKFQQVDNSIDENKSEINKVVTGLGETNKRIDSQDIAIQDKAPLEHTHGTVTNTEAGFMSVSDKQKLDSLNTPPPPAAKTHIHVVTSAIQGLLKETSNKVLFNNVLEDVNGEFDIETNSITVKESGMYLINSVVEIENTINVTAPRLFLQVFKNSIQDITLGLTTMPMGVLGGVNGSTILSLETGDVIDVRVWVNHAVNTRGRGTIYEYVKFTRIW